MLTENEKQWLEDRKHKAYCRYCNVSKLCANPFASGYSCPLTGNMKDAIEFSERVAAKLARWDNEYHKGDHLCPYGDDDLDSYIPLCHCINFCQDHPRLGCIAAKLAWARLAVEEEMDANS